jgi:PAS domain S-box-containing protein
MSLHLAAAAMETLAKISPDPIIGLDTDGNVDLWSAAAERLFGIASEDAIGKPLPLAMPVVMSDSPSSVTYTTPDGRRLELELELRQAQRLIDGKPRGHVIIATDRTELIECERRAAEKLRDEGRFRELLEVAPDAIIEADAEGRIVTCNRAAEALFRYDRDELLRLNVDDLVPPAMRPKHAAERTRYHAQPTTRPMGRNLILSALRRDGSEVPVEISLSPVRSEDGFHTTAIIRDITDRRGWEEKLRVANQELEARNREVERANRLKSEFLASMSHELRTPLHTIIGFTELLAEELEGPLNEKQKRFVTHVHKDAIHLLELINDVLDLSKIESGRLELDIRSIDLAAVLTDTLEGIEHAASAKNIRIENAVPAGANVMADRVRLREILTNLLSNAVKFTPEGGRVEIRASRENGFVRIEVSDTGIGISPDDQQVIFDKFRQVGATTRGVREGTGLGLAIVRNLVEMHGGTVSVKSVPGEGSSFWFTIPQAGRGDGRVPLVMIVEDEPGARELIASYLNPIGVRTQAVANPATAIQTAIEMKPDAITLDLVMPRHSGWRVLEELKRSPETSRIPVLVLSVLDRDREALALGATEYLQKPVQRETLLHALRMHVPAIAAIS